MAEHSTIEWTQATWNPVTGCTKVSPGCAHCYAETFAERFRGVPGHPYQQGFDLRLWPERLPLPLQWSRPRMIFVNSMSDLFHEDVPDDFIAEVFDVMTRASWHTFQVLTKRAERLVEMARRLPWPNNVWMGVSVENQRFVSRADLLRQTPARVKFLSCEPLLGPLRLDLHGIDWVIVGGESGPGARPMRPEWARDVREQCQRAGVPFFFKQWGAHDERGLRVGKGKAGRLLDGRTWEEMPAVCWSSSGPRRSRRTVDPRGIQRVGRYSQGCVDDRRILGRAG
ncbi:MAG TPA: phage Gp37/Gp68 family protein [Dehalococcoidia bacterium]|nr:phage Gp37/Gp68 family protein [Dehalococcoidia bacterium]